MHCEGSLVSNLNPEVLSSGAPTKPTLQSTSWISILVEGYCCYAGYCAQLEEYTRLITQVHEDGLELFRGAIVSTEEPGRAYAVPTNPNAGSEAVAMQPCGSKVRTEDVVSRKREPQEATSEYSGLS